MKTTLVVSYLPSGEQSFSKKLLDRFMEKSHGKTKVVHRNLLKTLPPVFDEVSLEAYRARNYGGQKLADHHSKAIKPFDELVKEIKSADYVVFVFPMHNFSLPGVVKTYIDAVFFHGELFQYTATGPQGLMGNTKAAILYASGGAYEPGNPYNVVPPVLDIDLGFAGFGEKRYINVGGTLGGPEGLAKNLEAAQAQVDKLVADWYAA
jgi:FMN-dependent NADH-azoreductase